MITRPNGKPYRPRIAPRVEEVSDDWGGIHPVITRTTDVCRIITLLAEHGFTPMGPWPPIRWWRQGFRDGEWAWVEDPVRGVPVTAFGPDKYSEFWEAGQ